MDMLKIATDIFGIALCFILLGYLVYEAVLTSKIIMHLNVVEDKVKELERKVFHDYDK